MTREDVMKRFPACGTIEKEYENSKWYSVFIQLLFMAAGMYFFWLMLNETTLLERLDNIAVLFFCLWRIHRQRDTMCYVAANGIIVRRQCASLRDYYDEQFHEERNLVYLPYKTIFLIADNWQEIEVGKAVEGGIAVLPVRLQFLSKKNKQRIIDRIKEEQEKDEDHE